MYSKVFDIEHSIQLDKIYRQDSESGLNKVLPILRNDTILKFLILLQGQLLVLNQLNV